MKNGNDMLVANLDEKTQLNAFNDRLLSQFELASLATSKYINVVIKVAEHKKTSKNTLLSLLNNSEELSVILTVIRNLNIELNQEDLEPVLEKYYNESFSVYMVIHTEIAKRKKALRYKKVKNFLWN
jgi:hypothetical protein